MKRLTAILLLLTYLFYTTGFSELLKVNVLVQHFYETKTNDPSITFIHFLVIHYITDDLNDKDNDRDSQLPFKSTETCISGGVILYIAQQSTPFLPAHSFAVKERNYRIANDAFTLPNHQLLVWHPPKYS